jgi:hypothetical protein
LCTFIYYTLWIPPFPPGNDRRLLLFPKELHATPYKIKLRRDSSKQLL